MPEQWIIKYFICLWIDFFQSLGFFNLWSVVHVDPKTVQSVFNSFCSFPDIRNKKPKSKLINSRVVAEPYSELYQRSKMECCENIKGWKPLTIFEKHFILDVYWVLNTLMGSTNAMRNLRFSLDFAWVNRRLKSQSNNLTFTDD